MKNPFLDMEVGSEEMMAQLDNYTAIDELFEANGGTLYVSNDYGSFSDGHLIEVTPEKFFELREEYNSKWAETDKDDRVLLQRYIVFDKNKEEVFPINVDPLEISKAIDVYTNIFKSVGDALTSTHKTASVVSSFLTKNEKNIDPDLKTAITSFRDIIGEKKEAFEKLYEEFVSVNDKGRDLDGKERTTEDIFTRVKNELKEFAIETKAFQEMGAFDRCYEIFHKVEDETKATFVDVVSKSSFLEEISSRSERPSVLVSNDGEKIKFSPDFAFNEDKSVFATKHYGFSIVGPNDKIAVIKNPGDITEERGYLPAGSAYVAVPDRNVRGDIGDFRKYVVDTLQLSGVLSKYQDDPDRITGYGNIIATFYGSGVLTGDFYIDEVSEKALSIFGEALVALYGLDDLEAEDKIENDEDQTISDETKQPDNEPHGSMPFEKKEDLENKKIDEKDKHIEGNDTGRIESVKKPIEPLAVRENGKISKENEYAADQANRSVIWNHTGDTAIDERIDRRNARIENGDSLGRYRSNTFFACNNFVIITKAFAKGISINGNPVTLGDVVYSWVAFTRTNLFESLVYSALDMVKVTREEKDVEKDIGKAVVRDYKTVGGNGFRDLGSIINDTIRSGNYFKKGDDEETIEKKIGKLEGVIEKAVNRYSGKDPISFGNTLFNISQIRIDTPKRPAIASEDKGFAFRAMAVDQVKNASDNRVADVYMAKTEDLYKGFLKDRLDLFDSKEKTYDPELAKSCQGIVRTFTAATNEVIRDPRNHLSEKEICGFIRDTVGEKRGITQDNINKVLVNFLGIRFVDPISSSGKVITASMLKIPLDSNDLKSFSVEKVKYELSNSDFSKVSAGIVVRNVCTQVECFKEPGGATEKTKAVADAVGYVLKDFVGKFEKGEMTASDLGKILRDVSLVDNKESDVKKDPFVFKESVENAVKNSPTARDAYIDAHKEKIENSVKKIEKDDLDIKNVSNSIFVVKTTKDITGSYIGGVDKIKTAVIEKLETVTKGKVSLEKTSYLADLVNMRVPKEFREIYHFDTKTMVVDAIRDKPEYREAVGKELTDRVSFAVVKQDGNDIDIKKSGTILFEIGKIKDISNGLDKETAGAIVDKVKEALQLKIDSSDKDPKEIGDVVRGLSRSNLFTETCKSAGVSIVDVFKEPIEKIAGLKNDVSLNVEQRLEKIITDIGKNGEHSKFSTDDIKSAMVDYIKMSGTSKEEFADKIDQISLKVLTENNEDADSDDVEQNLINGLKDASVEVEDETFENNFVDPEEDVDPKEDPEEDVEAEETIDPDEAVEPEETMSPEEDVEAEETVDPEEDIEAEETMDPDEDIDAEETVDPEDINVEDYDVEGYVPEGYDPEDYLVEDDDEDIYAEPDEETVVKNPEGVMEKDEKKNEDVSDVVAAAYGTPVQETEKEEKEDDFSYKGDPVAEQHNTEDPLQSESPQQKDAEQKEPMSHPEETKESAVEENSGRSDESLEKGPSNQPGPQFDETQNNAYAIFYSIRNFVMNDAAESKDCLDNCCVTIGKDLVSMSEYLKGEERDPEVSAAIALGFGEFIASNEYGQWEDPASFEKVGDYFCMFADSGVDLDDVKTAVVEKMETLTTPTATEDMINDAINCMTERMELLSYDVEASKTLNMNDPLSQEALAEEVCSASKPEIDAEIEKNVEALALEDFGIIDSGMEAETWTERQADQGFEAQVPQDVEKTNFDELEISHFSNDTEPSSIQENDFAVENRGADDITRRMLEEAARDMSAESRIE